jgi:hypothetical protein
MPGSPSGDRHRGQGHHQKERIMQPARCSSSLLGLLAAVGLAACAPPESAPMPPDEAVETVRQPIIGGTPATSCQWPTAVGAVNCTSTLVHPRIITTADHCVADGGPPHITFGERWSGSGVVKTVNVTQCFGAAAAGLAGDFGFCILAEPVDMKITPVLFGCETEVLAPDQDAVLVGYGQRAWWDFRAGTKFKVDVKVNRVDGVDIYLGNSRRGSCYGDSGGPAYVKLADGSWRVFGATSRGALFCNGESIYTLIHPFVPWVEETSGIDITPCHDSDGTWNPGADCQGFPTNPEAGVGSWDDLCAAVDTSGPGASCGPASGG